MIPKETRCRWCGKPILFAPGKDGRQIPIDSKLKPYSRTIPIGGYPTTLFTIEGGRITCVELPEEWEDQADGYAHRMHICRGMPRYGRPARRDRRGWDDEDRGED